MATDPGDIRLNIRQKESLAELADNFRRDWTEVFDAVLSMARFGTTGEQFAWLRAQEESLVKIWDNESDSIFDDL